MFGRLVMLSFVFLISCKPDLSQENDVTIEDSIVLPTDHLIEGRDIAEQQLKEVLALHIKPFSQDGLIKDSATATAIAEPILFNVYGKEQILEQRPYEVYLIDSMWYLTGTIPKGNKGGGFEIIINSRDGRIMSLRHYK